MKKLLPFFVILIGISELHSQTPQTPLSVFDCNTIDPLVTPLDILNNAPEFYKPCLLFSSQFQYFLDVASNKTYKALEEIHIEPGFHAGPHTTSGQTHLQIIPKSDFDVVAINYSNLNGILRYKKFELGIELPSDLLAKINNYLFDQTGDKINPFLEGELDVEIKFKHLATGTEKSIDCFYYREFERNLTTKDWVDAPNDYVIRGRFAPPLNGAWQAYATIEVNGVQVEQSAPFVFNVVESGDKGFVKVHQNKRNFQHGDRMIFPVGHCMISPYVNVAVWNPNPWDVNKAAQVDDWMQYLADISNYADQGGKFIEVGQYNYSANIEFTKLGNYYDRLHYAWEYDHVLDICEEKDILMEFNLMWHTQIMKVGDAGQAHWDFYTEAGFPKFCYNDENILGPNPEPKDMFLDPTMMEYHKQRNRYYISRYGYSTKIFEFQLLSEPWHLNQIAEETEPIYSDPVVQDALVNYHTEIAKYIKQNLGHKEHLIGVDINLGEWDNFSNPGYIDQSIYDENVDVVDLNLYNAFPEKEIKGKEDGSNTEVVYTENSMYAQMAYVHVNLHKPVFMAESGHGGNNVMEVNPCSSYTGHFVDVMSQGFNGCAGFMMWDGQAYPPFGDVDQREVCWPSTIRAQQHYNADDFINTLMNGNGIYTQGRQTAKLVLITPPDNPQQNVDAVELQYYISEDKEKAVGYIRNRSYNVHTKRTSESCSLDLNTDELFSDKEPIDDLTNLEWNDFIPNRRLKLEELKQNKDYRIEWYSFKTGSYMETQCKNTDGTNLVLEYPELVVENDDENDNPVLWFVLYQYDCQQGLNLYNGEVTYNFEVNSDQLYREKRKEILPIIYPNPISTFLNIDSPINDTIQFENVESQVIMEKSIENGISKVDLSFLNSGIYILKFTNQGFIFKIIKI